MTRPTIDLMDETGLSFHLEDEPSRTRSDAAEAARTAAVLLEAVLHDAVRASFPIQDSGLKGPDDRVYRLPLSGIDAISVMRRKNRRLELGVTNGDAVLLTCSIDAKWTRPSHLHFAAAARLFLAATHAVVDPAAGDQAHEVLRAHGASMLAKNADSVILQASLPWTDGSCEHVVFAGHDRYDISMSWGDVTAAAVSCVSTFGGITIDVNPLRIEMRRNDLDPMETLRLLAMLGDKD